MGIAWVLLTALTWWIVNGDAQTSSQVQIPLCCPPKEELHSESFRCQNSAKTLSEADLSQYFSLVSPRYTFAVQFPNCSGKMFHVPQGGDVSLMMTEQNIWLAKRDQKNLTERYKTFCLSSSLSEIVVYACGDDLLDGGHYAEEELFTAHQTSNASQQEYSEAPQTISIDCTTSTCISKCCPVGHVLNIDTGAKCDSDPSPQTPLDITVTDAKNVTYVLNKVLHCLLTERTDFVINSNGSLKARDRPELYYPGQYCVDKFNIEGTLTTYGLVCFEEEDICPEYEYIRWIQYVGIVFSALCLVTLSILTLLIPRLREKELFSMAMYIYTLCIAFCLMLITRSEHQWVGVGGCTALVFILQFAFLSAYCWFNIMCFDIWRIIRGSLNLHALEILQRRDKRRRLLYSAYTFLIPLAALCLTLTAHYLPDESRPRVLPDPGIAHGRCWFTDDYEILFIYYYGWEAILLIVNIVFIGNVVFVLCKERVVLGCHSTKKTIRNTSKDHLQTFWQRFLLFIFVSIVWIGDILSFIPPKVMWTWCDTLNSLQGVYIFCIFFRRDKSKAIFREAASKLPRISFSKSESSLDN